MGIKRNQVTVLISLILALSLMREGRAEASIGSTSLAESLFDSQFGARMLSCNLKNGTACTYRLIVPSYIAAGAKFELQGSTGDFGLFADNIERGKKVLCEEESLRKSMCDGRFTIASFPFYNRYKFKLKTAIILNKEMRIEICFKGTCLNFFESNVGVILLERNCKDAGVVDWHDNFSIEKITIDGKDYLPEDFKRTDGKK